MIFTVICRIKVMVNGCKHYIVSNERTVPNDNAALILKMAAGIDKHIFPNRDIFSEVRVKWWKL